MRDLRHATLRPSTANNHLIRDDLFSILTRTPVSVETLIRLRAIFNCISLIEHFN